MSSLSDLRTSFIDYFVKHDHKQLKSSNLVPTNDATLLFTNSGMVQFKDYLIGNLQTNDKRVVTSQKCLRAGGKHNDLENVGYTARHHTFFEMLGNFSFGDYFKEKAIFLAWNLLTKEYGISKDKLLITIYHDDEESFKLWKKIAGLVDSRIIRIATSDNFWQMGDFGPCGPCSEIFYDYGDKYQGGPPGSKDQDGDRFIEIWNLVFMQFEKLSDGRTVNLPKPSIDTGMGLERIAALMQGVHDNYDTDLIKSIINQITHLLNAYSITVDLTKHRNSLKVIADHIRSIGFLISEGVMPSNEGRGYILRRIMRRAMRHAYLLGIREPFLFKLADHFIDLMSGHFIELSENREFINETILFEEQRFQSTLDRGLKLLNKEITDLPNSKIISGKFAYKLYDTYGFPIDLTTDILKDLGIKLNYSEYDKEVTLNKVLAKQSWHGTKDKKFDKVWYNLAETLPATEFLGYNNLTISAEVLAIILIDSNKLEIVSSAKASQEILFVTNQTPFYPESGGQIGDSGFARLGEELDIKISDCQRVLAGIIYQKARILKGVLKTGDNLTLSVDQKRREKIATSHSATHLVHSALRQVLGNHVVQKGSLVAENSFRFDFAHNKPLTDNEILEVENIVNTEIKNNSDVKIKTMQIDEAKKIGATALFGEKYDDEVRVVFMAGQDSDWSIELCGGCHVVSTGKIQLFKIISSTSVAAGIRRIEAVTSDKAIALFQNNFKMIENLSQSLKVKSTDLAFAIKKTNESNKLLDGKIKILENKLATAASKNLTIDKVGCHDFAYLSVSDHNKSDLKNLLDQLKSKIKSGLAVLANLDNSKKNITILIAAKGLDNQKINLSEVAQLAAKFIDGRGGGKDKLFQIGSSKTDKLPDAINLIKNYFVKAYE